MEGGGVIAHPTAGQVILTVILVMFLVFLMAAGSKAFELIGEGFKRLGRLFAKGEKKAAKAEAARPTSSQS